MSPDAGVATRDAWKTTPMPSAVRPIAYRASFTVEEYERLRRGLIPDGMDGKWFIYLEDDVLYLHRSWTGTCIYRVRLGRAGDGYDVLEAEANDDSEQYPMRDSAYDAALLEWLVANLLLGAGKRFPVPEAYARRGAPGAFQHSAAGTGYPEYVFPRGEGDS